MAADRDRVYILAEDNRDNPLVGRDIPGDREEYPHSWWRHTLVDHLNLSPQMKEVGFADEIQKCLADFLGYVKYLLVSTYPFSLIFPWNEKKSPAIQTKA